MQLTPQHLFDTVEVFDFRVEVLVVEIKTTFVNLLEYAVDLAGRPFTTVSHTLPILLEAAFLRPSSALEPTTEFTHLLLPMCPHRYQSICSIEHQGQSIGIAKVAASAEAGQCLHMCAVLGEVACEFGEGEEMIRNWSAHQLDVLQQSVVGSQLAATHHLPPLSRLLQHACEVKPLEDDQALARGSSFCALSNEDGISGAEDGESMWFTVLPLAVDVLAVGDVDEGVAVDAVLFPMRDVKGEVVVDEDAQSVSLTLRVHLSLVLAVAEVRFLLHFNNKIISTV